MWVWKRSPEGIRISMENDGLVADFLRALPDFMEKDNVGSPYCLRRYVVDAHLGGPEALAVARSKLAQRGMRLILDFVPNHVAPDHPWVHEHPEYFIQGNEEELKAAPQSFVNLGGRVFACGRDPYFPAWPDVLQLNAFDKGLRSAVIETLSSIASQCDGARCDMAMLLINSIFGRTWGLRAGSIPEADYWLEVIPAVKEKYPEFQFIAEAYWDLEWELQQQGFDYCYDKRLYDRLEHDSAENVRLHLCADEATRKNAWRFIVAAFYGQLLGSVAQGGFPPGAWSLCERTGWPDNGSCLNLVAWCWRNEQSRRLIAVNLSDSPSQALVKLPGMISRACPVD